MSEHAGPKHDTDCLALHIEKAYCGCSRAAWLGEMVPRAQARIELLTQLENWSREQRTFQDGDLNSFRASFGTDPELVEFVRDGARLAASVVRSTWERMAVRAMHMREECAARLAEMEKRSAAQFMENMPTPGQVEQSADDEVRVVTVQAADKRL